MRRLLLLALSGCGACATAYDPAPTIAWSIDDSCEPATEADLQAIGDAAALLIPLGVVVAPNAPDATMRVTYCFTAGPAVVVAGSRYRGHTVCDGSECYTRVNHLETVPVTYPALVAHEAAHALGVDGHLAAGEIGIMTAEAIRCDAEGCSWSAADLALLATYGVL